MKKLLTLLALLASLSSHAQGTPAAYPKDPSTGLIDYTEVIPVDGATKSDLFTRSKLWLASTFKSAKDVVQTEDKEAGLIVGRGYSVIQVQSGKFTFPAKLFYTLKLNFKDNKYKYELTDFYFENEPRPETGYRIIKTPAETWVLASPKDDRAGKVISEYKNQFDQTSQAIITSLKSAMLKPSDF